MAGLYPTEVGTPMCAAKYLAAEVQEIYIFWAY